MTTTTIIFNFKLENELHNKADQLTGYPKDDACMITDIVYTIAETYQIYSVNYLLDIFYEALADVDAHYDYDDPVYLEESKIVLKDLITYALELDL